MRDFSELMDKLDMMSPLIDAIDDPQIKSLSKFLAERISSPESFVTFLGETSSGKTTLINGLIGKPLLPMKACPTTGAVSEIILSPDEEKDAFYAINKDATMEALDKQTCMSLIMQPDENLSRVRIVTHSPDCGLRNMRIFDTPGYDSIVSEHEEILKEFLPNSDVVVYTVGYKIGIQQTDYAFLGFLKELLREDADILLVINRCPVGTADNDPRVCEIRRYAKDILLQDTPYFLITEIKEEGDAYPLPAGKKLWGKVNSLVNSEKRRSALYDAFDSYIFGLYEECHACILNRYTTMQLDAETMRELIKEQNNTAERIREAVKLFLIPGFEKIAGQIPGQMKYAAKQAKKNIITEIEDIPKGKMDEMTVYAGEHLVPFYIRRESEEIQNFIQVSLEDINRQVDDYLNREICEFNTKISVVLSTHAELAARNVAGKIANKAGYHALRSYFAAFGGAGGANAGIANAASHMLKKIGDLFGKTFSRETHNALKHILKKIGATSMKAVGVVLSIIFELVGLALDYGTWKKKLISNVEEAVNKWKDETSSEILADLESLKNNNIQVINEIADEVEHTFEQDASRQELTVRQMRELLDDCEQIGKKIGADAE